MRTFLAKSLGQDFPIATGGKVSEIGPMKRHGHRRARAAQRWMIQLKSVGILLLLHTPAVGAQRADSAAQARNPREVQPERPTVATHAGTVAPGWIELESGGEWDRYADGGKVVSFPTNLKIGVGPRAQVNLIAAAFVGTAIDRSVRGIGDVTIGLKYRMIDDAPLLGDFAILPSVKLPTASSARGLGTGTTDASLLLISSRSVGPVDVDVNLGATRRSGDGATAPNIATLWTVSAGAPIAGRFGWTAEVFGYPGTSGDAGAKGIVALLAGPTFQPALRLAVDAGVIVPVTGPQPKALYTGFVWNIGPIP